jgi:hypothetical protein
MPVLAIIFGFILDILGVAGFVFTGASQVTALIPSFFGTIILVCGLLALWKGGAVRKHAMHVAAAVGLLGFLGGIIRSGPKLGAVLAGQPVEPSATAVWLQFSFAVICLIFVAACIRSFIQARLQAAKA